MTITLFIQIRDGGVRDGGGKFLKSISQVVGHCEDCKKNFTAAFQNRLDETIKRHRKNYCPAKNVVCYIFLFLKRKALPHSVTM